MAAVRSEVSILSGASTRQNDLMKSEDTIRDFGLWVLVQYGIPARSIARAGKNAFENVGDARDKRFGCGTFEVESFPKPSISGVPDGQTPGSAWFMSNQPTPRPERQPAAELDPPAERTCDFTADKAAAELVSILDEYLADLKAGRAPNRQELMARHPTLASQLEACLAGLEFIHGAESAAPGKAQRLGDFRIIREVGRGGMGAVFEAEQISLGRSVALKILRYGAVSDPESIERFKREAETVAKLHHTNIVPIFNVGSEQGVNYYAMQFIEGRSLAEVLAEKREPLAASQVAEWGLQAAEALDHAHHRGVIHRDVKPSNLLLDRENRIWLTDFGLARRMDDVTLSITGALLGTPRYMSPEQAAATRKRVDHRTDLFSLGATLYELLTGEPAFQGNTPHDVIQRILNTEPTPVRKLANSVPRDLETVVMKCLAKEPGQRYDAASDLVEDLRACLDARPIRARRVGWAERTARWVKRQQHSVKLAATAVALTLLVTIGGMLGWSGYEVWRQAAIKLNATTPPLVVEILDTSHRLVRVETAPMQNAIDVPAGDYRLRVSGEGKLSETFDVALTRGSESNFTLDLHDQLLWTPRDIERGFDIVDFGAEQGMVLWNEKGFGLRRHLPVQGWTREVSAGHLAEPDKAPGFQWPWNQAWQEHSGYGPYDTRPWVAPRTVDIDGQGLGDLIVAARHQAWLMAVSGDDGRILWFAARGHDLASPPPQKSQSGNGVASAILGNPICGHDCDDDGTPDVIATMADIGQQPTLVRNRYVARCWIEAISGKTGESIWTYEIPSECFDLPEGQEVPYELRWFAGTNGGKMSDGGGRMTLRRHRIRDGGQRFERTGPHGYRPASVELVTRVNSSRLVVVAGTHVLTLDSATGKSDDEPIDLKSRPGRDCQWGDVDGDGISDLVLIERVSAGNAGTGFLTPTTARLVVWSLAKGKQLWAKALDARWPQQPTWTVEAPRWPLVVDLDGDKKCEIVVPDGRSGSNWAGGAGSFSSVPWGMVAALAGSTGEPIWTRRLVSMDQQIDHFVAGPDVDQDGYREVYTFTLAGSEFNAYFDALSGQNGNPLWTNSLKVPPDQNSSVEYHLTAPQWWQAGSDGWPMLIGQAVEGSVGSRRTFVGAFSAGTGQLAHVGRNITAVLPADIDGDGTQDLLVYDSKTHSALDLGGTVHCLRGVANERWARLGDKGDPVADFDGDGTRDLLVGYPSDTLTATSGATGEILWRSQVSDNRRPYQVRSAATRQGSSADLDGDGIGDLLGWTHVSHYYRRGEPFFAVSGKTGKKLWTAPDISVQMLSGVWGAEAHDLDGDGKVEVLWLAALDYGYALRTSVSSHESQMWIFVTSGQTGKLLWSQPLSATYGQTPGIAMQVNVSQVVVSPTVGDINGDGTSDVLVPELLPDGRTLQTVALSGRDGMVLWSRPCPVNPSQQVSLQNWMPPTIGDLDGDGRPEVVVIENTNLDESNKPILARYRVVSVHGHDGSEIWNWISETGSSYWQPALGESKGELMRPRLLRTGGKECKVAVLLPGDDAAVVVIGHDGIPHQRKANNQTAAAGLWACDADGDGVDEVAFFDQASLCMARADMLDQPRWTQPMGYEGQHRILGILSQDAKPSPVVAVARDGTDNSVLGFDAATGRRVWSCPGVISRDAGDGTYMVPQHVALLDGNIAPPHVYYNYGAVSRCRQAISTPGMESQPDSYVSLVASVAVDRLPGSGPSFAPTKRYSVRNDERWARDLPWVEHRAPVKEIATLILWSVVFAILLVVLPVGCLVRLVMLRRFGLRTLMTVPIVAGVFLTASLIKTPIERDFDGLVARLSMGFMFSPVVIAIGSIGVWSARGRWRRVLLWLGTTLVVSSICASVLLWTSAQQGPQLPEVRFDLTGWYLIGFIGAYLTSWLLVIVLLTKHTALWALNRWRRGRRHTQTTETPQPDPTMAAKLTSSQ